MHSEVNSCQVHLKTKATSRGSAKVIGTLRNIIDRNITNTISKLYGRYSVSIGRAETLQHAIFLFRRYCGRSDILKTLSSAAIRRPLPYGAHILEAIASRRIQLGYAIHQQHNLQKYMKQITGLIVINGGQHMQQLMHYLLDSNWCINISNIIWNRKQKLYLYPKYFDKESIYKIHKQWCFDESFLTKLSDKNDTFSSLYDILVNEESVSTVRFHRLQFGQYLSILSDNILAQRFGINRPQDAETLAIQVKRDRIYTLQQLKSRLFIARHIEQCGISMVLADQFQLQDIPDTVLADLFYNLDRRLQRIDSSKNLLIVNTISDNKIYRLELKHDYNVNTNQTDVETILSETSGPCNVVIVTQCQTQAYTPFSALNLRYLCYINKYSYLHLYLANPACLVSAVLECTKITNMSECTLLQSLYSYKNEYKSGDFSGLINLRRICSLDDTYHDKTQCLLQAVFKCESIEYVHIWNNIAYSNVVASCVLDTNISKLRYLLLYQEKEECRVILNIHKEFPHHLQVFDIETNGKVNIGDEDSITCGEIDGPEIQTRALKKQLVHETKGNRKTARQQGWR